MRKRFLAMVLTLAMCLALLPAAALAAEIPEETSYWHNISTPSEATDILNSISAKSAGENTVFIFYNPYTCGLSKAYVPQYAAFANEAHIKMCAFAFVPGDDSTNISAVYRALGTNRLTWPAVILYNAATGQSAATDANTVLGLDQFKEHLARYGLYDGSTGDSSGSGGQEDPDVTIKLIHDSSISSMSWEVLRLTNQHRMSMGLEPLSTFGSLQKTANQRAYECGSLYDHIRPDGRDYSTAYDDYQVANYNVWQENIACGQSSAGSVMSAWLNSPGHRRNIEEASVTHMSVGYHHQSSQYEHYWSQNFVGSSGCSLTSLSLSKSSVKAKAGQSLEELLAQEDITVTANCPRHGSCKLPLIAAMCSGYDPDRSGEQTVTAACGNGSAAFTVTSESAPEAGPSAPQQFQIQDDGTLTSYTGPGGEVVIPDSVTRIGKKAFYECDGMTGVIIPDSVTSIGESAFFGCKGLTSVAIPRSVTGIDGSAFAFCSNLTEFRVHSGNREYTAVNGVLFTKDGKTLAACPGGKKGAYSIPGGVTRVGDCAFAGCGDLTRVTIPDSVTELGERAFYGCVQLTAVTVPDGVSKLAWGVFSFCSKLASVSIPGSVTQIEPNAFYRSAALKDIYFDGTEAQWKDVVIGSDNTPLDAAALHCSGKGDPAAPDKPALPAVEDIPSAGTAYARTQRVKLDGRGVAFQCYAVKDAKGNETNYVKLRDLALALNGTKAQFDVGWDGKISITSGTAYKYVGGEGATPYSGSQPYKAVSGTPVNFNGSQVKLTSFSITYRGGGYTYYKLRDLGQLLNFNVKWDGSVVIETDKPYTGI